MHLHTILKRSIFCSAIFFALNASVSAQTIFIVRHAEKVSEAPDALLSDEGHQRAACLAQMLRDADIKAIFVTDVERTQQTAAPLAKLLNLKPTIIAADDVDKLVAQLRAHPGQNVLVVGHSDTVPEIIEKLGASKVVPIGKTEYDRLFLLKIEGKHKAQVTTLHYSNSSR